VYKRQGKEVLEDLLAKSKKLKPREVKPAINLATGVKKSLGDTEELKLLKTKLAQMQRSSDPAVNVLPKGRGKIKLPGQGEDITDLVKIKAAGGKTRITKDDLSQLNKIKDLPVPKGPVAHAGRVFENPIRLFEQSNSKELFYRPIKAAEKRFFDEAEATAKTVKEVRTAAVKSNKKAPERIMLHAIAQESGGAKQLQAIGKVAPDLTKEELKAYNFLRKEYDSLLDRLNESRIFAGKKPINRRENYFTHIREMNALEELGYSTVGDDVADLITKGIHRNAPSFRFAKSRTGAPMKKIELDAFNVFNKYREPALYNINLTPEIAKIREMTRTKITDPVSKEVFEFGEKYPQLKGEVDSWLDVVAKQDKESIKALKPFVNIAKVLNQNVVFSTMAFNIQSAVIQPSAIISTVTEIGPKFTQKGIQQLMVKGWDEAFELSNVLKGRKFDTAIEDIGNLGGRRRKLARAGMKPLQALDQVTATATWYGAHDLAKARGLTGKAATNFADDVVVRTQASASPSDLAEIQRSDMGKLLTTFQTFVINQWNWLKRDVAGIGNKEITKKEATKKLLTYISAVGMWNVLSDKVGIPTPFPQPFKSYREEETRLGGAKEVGRELASVVPVLGGTVRFGGSLGGPLVDTIQKGFSIVSGKYSNNTPAEVIAKLLGIPGVSQMKKTLKGLGANLDEYTVTTKSGKEEITPEGLDAIRSLLFGPYNTREAQQVRLQGARSNTAPGGIPGLTGKRSPAALPGLPGSSRGGSGLPGLPGAKKNTLGIPGL
jgi:hypothetical protein